MIVSPMGSHLVLRLYKSFQTVSVLYPNAILLTGKITDTSIQMAMFPFTVAVYNRPLLQLMAMEPNLSEQTQTGLIMVRSVLNWRA